MNKMIARNYIGIIMFTLLLNPIKTISQNQPGEVEIKKSGKYFWGQAYNIDSIQARLDARDDLMDKVSNQISNSSTLNARSDLMVRCIRYIYKPVEELTKAIAYVTKEDVTNIIANRKSLSVNEIKYTEGSITSNSNADIKTEKLNRLSQDNTLGREREPIVRKDLASAPIENALIDKLIACNTGDDLRLLLKKEEDKNTVIFNWDSKTYRKSVSSESFYIALIDPNNNKIIAFLDKGKSERKDLKNGQRIITIGPEYQKMIQVWIQLL